MDEKYSTILRNNFARFVQDLDVTNVFPQLRQDEVLSKDEMQKITNLPADRDRNMALLDVILCKGNPGYRSFCAAIEDTSPHLHEILERGCMAVEGI